LTAVERAAGAVLLLGALAAGGIVAAVWPRLFDSTPAGLGTLAAARCSAPQASCQVELLTLSPGRFWLEPTESRATAVELDYELHQANGAPRALLLGASADGLQVAVERSADGSAWDKVPTRESGGGSRRRVVALDAPPTSGWLRVTLTRETAAAAAQLPPSSEAGTGAPLRVEEIGLFPSESGLAADTRAFLRSLPDRRVYYGLLARACLWIALLGVVAAFGLRTRLAWLLPAFVFFITLAASCLMLYAEHNPYWYRARDLRVLLASGPMQEGIGANLNYGMYLGSRLLAGQGLTFGPGWVPWERMPGYGLFGALAGVLSGFTTDLFEIGLTSIRLHLLLLAGANAAFAAAALRVMGPGPTAAAAALVCFMPNQLANTQADSIMVALYLMTAATLCLYLERERIGGWPPLRYHVLVHLSFALWFLTRPEGVVGWAALSLVLYRRRHAWRYLLLPAALYLAIGVSWAIYKGQYTGEFSMTTNTVGDNAWIGLWQVPSKFRWQTADPSYFEWAQKVDVPPTSKKASDRALREVARFVVTYPVYGAHLVLFRFLQFVDVNVFNGVLSYPHVVYERLRGPAVWALLGVVALCLVLPHDARRTLFLGWPLFFNLPLFLIFFSDGMRHVAPCTAALLVTAFPPILERAFYAAVLGRWRRSLAVAVVLLALCPTAYWADRAILASDAWRYWTPLLDPAPFAWYLR
jgi:hypothetical protein